MKQFRESLTRLNAGSDDHLTGYFTVTDSIRQLADFSGDKVLAVGLKGIGKTAAFRYFAEMKDESDVLAIGINSHRYKLYLPTVGLNSATCQAQFEHDLVVEALRAISESGGDLKERLGPRNIKAAKAQVGSYRARLKALAGTLAGSGVSLLGVGFTVGTPQQVLVGLRPVQEVRESLEELKRICELGIRIRIVVDDPELVFSVSQELDVSLIGGFFLAALDISRQIPQLKVIVLTKTHVYHPVAERTEDFDKYPGSRVELSWSREELVDLIASRLAWATTKWTDVFAMPESKARKYLESRVCGGIRNGPRDLLHWVDRALTNAKGGKIGEGDFDATRKEIAKYSYASLGQSFESLYPKIKAVIAEIFRREPNRLYKLDEFRHHLEALMATDPTMKNLVASLTWMQQQTHYTLPELLFQVGAVALGSGDRLILPYEREYDTEHFEAVDSVRLVPALVEAL